MSDSSRLSIPNSPAASFHEGHRSHDGLSPGTTLVSPGSPMMSPTRTVAIIKPHALDHRFEIEQRITEASFEIVKERQMEFDVETDPDTLFDLFGDDARAFAEGPVWVYVLERRRAIEVWNTVMGDPDPEVARHIAPNSLRALYGISAEQNAVMGSPDVEIAEIQIASLFVSSPPFPTSELPEEHPMNGSVRSVSSSVFASLRRGSDAGLYSTLHTKSPASSNGSKPTFKARPLPSTHVTPSIAPRTTRAADLRAGILPADDAHSGPRVRPSRERLVQMFANVPGHKRTESIAVASTAPPVMAPRMTRAASLRLGQPPVTLQRPRTSEGTSESAKATFEGVPGHKRRESISVASTKAPNMAPRLNKSAALRAQKDNAPPSSFSFRSASTQAPTLSRSSSRSQLVPSRPASAQSYTSPAPARRAPSRATSTPQALKTPATPAPAAADPAPAARKTRPSSLSAPIMAPRQNKSAMLRAAKMAEATPTKPARYYRF